MEDQRQGALVAALLTPKSRRWFSSKLISLARVQYAVILLSAGHPGEPVNFV